MSVTSTVLCVIIWLLDIIILALSYSEFCKETQELVVTVEVKNSRAPRNGPVHIVISNKSWLYHLATKERVSWTIARCRASVFTRPRGSLTVTEWFARFSPFSPHSLQYQASGLFDINVDIDPSAQGQQPKTKAHSEAGGACMSNQNSFRASLLCSLICLVSSSFGAFIRNMVVMIFFDFDRIQKKDHNHSAKLALITRNSPVQGVDPHVVDYIKVRILENEISILQSCLFIESGLQVTKRVLWHLSIQQISSYSPYSASTASTNAATSFSATTPTMQCWLGPMAPKRSSWTRSCRHQWRRCRPCHKWASINEQWWRNQLRIPSTDDSRTFTDPFTSSSIPTIPHAATTIWKSINQKTRQQHTSNGLRRCINRRRYNRHRGSLLLCNFNSLVLLITPNPDQQQKPAPFHPLTTSCSSSRDDDNSSLTNNDRRHSISSHFDTRNLEYKTQLQQEQQQQQGSTIKRPRSKSSDRLMSSGGQTKKCVSFKRQTSEYDFQ